MKIKRIVRIFCLAIILAAAPILLTVWDSNISVFNDAEASMGVCCAGSGICVIGDHTITESYMNKPGTGCGAKEIR
ncbi:hypothetical protein [Fodinibius halophilus]|uniref:Uncharacterized protein n=1 Tax=Fodinibius halophilus TaxID=1736908 RepID=A0A6M1T7V8_9BACT|nr:hypothetical protein [Fodinibius halophilus]NGP88723.1 hypothetical protein [Fodinibius halophilus]